MLGELLFRDGPETRIQKMDYAIDILRREADKLRGLGANDAADALIRRAVALEEDESKLRVIRAYVGPVPIHMRSETL